MEIVYPPLPSPAPWLAVPVRDLGLQCGLPRLFLLTYPYLAAALLRTTDNST